MFLFLNSGNEESIGTFNFACGVKVSRELSRIGLFIKTQRSKFRRFIGGKQVK